MIEEFEGKLLMQQEPDASSFPSGGIRATFEARGYSAWDPTSPVFIIDDTLCIPTIFISYTGEALDYKAPLLKAIRAVDKAATDVCHYFDKSVKKVNTYLGWEQEYFLIDEDMALARPDLQMTGRTLMGHDSAKNQQLDDHYFGSIPERVAAFMRDLEVEALKLGIPAKTCHNEVAPNQFELAPIYEECNLAVRLNTLTLVVDGFNPVAVNIHCNLCCFAFVDFNRSESAELIMRCGVAAVGIACIYLCTLITAHIACVCNIDAECDFVFINRVEICVIIIELCE
jgi:glutamine synthetase